jgi:ribosomal protein S27AE
VYHYTCNTCDFTLQIDLIPRVYLFDDGRQLNMQQRHIWCTQCDCVTVAESLVESPGRQIWLQERYQRQIEKLANADLTDAIERNSVEKSIQAMDNYFQLLKEWQSVRKREPFCLRCGNSSIVVPESEFSDLPHPTCGGRLECMGSAQGGTYVGFAPHKYSVDGEFIEPGSCPNLWWPT